MNSEIAFYTNFHVKSAYIDTWLGAATMVIDSMSKEGAFVSAYLHKDTNDPTRFTLYERWNEPTMEAFIKNQLKGKSYREDYEKQLSEWLQSPRAFSQLELIQNWKN